VAKLEEAIGGLLVKRTTRSVALTALGRRLATRSQPLLDELDDCVDEAVRVAKGMEGQLSVGCVSSIAYALLGPVVADFRHRHPNLRFTMKDGDGFRITDAVLNHEVEFGVTTVVTHSKDLHAELVGTDPFVFVCGRDHPLATKKLVRWEQIRTFPLMGFRASSTLRQTIDMKLEKEGIELLWFDEVETLSSLISNLRTGAFLGVVPKLIASHLDGLASVALTGPRIQRKLYLARRSDTEFTPPVQAFWHDVQRCVTAVLRSKAS
jgi:DNA-binding transcriptional LysR family regulator